MLSYILWDQSAELFSLGRFTMHWNGLLMILAFIVGRQILVSIYRRESKPVKDVDILTAYLILGLSIGARLGHVIFFQPQLWSKPLTIFLPFEFKPSFHFTGMTGFSIHGAFLGLLLAAWLFSRTKRTGQQYLQVLDRISILSAMIAVPFLVGSFLNSEAEGKPTNSIAGTIFIQPVKEGLQQLPCCIMRNPGGQNPLTQVVAKKDKDVFAKEIGHHAVAIYFFFKSATPVELVDDFMLGDVKTYLFDNPKTVYEPGTEPLHYAVFKETNGDFEVRVRTIGIARYPVQLFEATACLLLFVFLFVYWKRNLLTLSPGRLFGFCMTIFWAMHFVLEFLKEDQSSFVKGLDLNKSQMLSMPMLIFGLFVLVTSYKGTAGPKK